jgi:hypothetical protein
VDTNTPDNTEEIVEQIEERVESRSATAAARGRTPKEVEVRVVRQERDLMLVDWNDGTRSKRAWVTPDMVVTKTDNVATVRDPNAGQPYGVDWSRLVELETTPTTVENELKSRGIWTLEDLRRNPVEVVSAIQAAYGFTRAKLLQAAERYEENLKKSEDRT